MSSRAPLMLVILDGWGHIDDSPTNAMTVARAVHMKKWMRQFPFTTLVAHNGLVGLPEGQMGNSEVGHLNIGAGRIVYQDFTRINRAIESGELARNRILSAAMEGVGPENNLHLFGLLSDGGVHSHIDHLFALLRMAADKGVQNIFVHCFMDGRDTAPKSGIGFMASLEEELARLGRGRIASVSGRYYAMDRDNRWDRVERAWQALVDGNGENAGSGSDAVTRAYDRGETDEFILPTVIADGNGQPVATVGDGDTVLFYNFRADRARELSRAFTERNFSGFAADKRPALAEFVTFTEYDSEFCMPVVFPPVVLKRILGEELSRHNLRQLRIAETEKYAHVTYFFNGGKEDPFPGEDRVLIESPRDVATYDQKPEMSAIEVTDRLLALLEKDEAGDKPYSLVVLNFANCDMVGHTGILDAAAKACATVDHCLGRIRDYMEARGGVMLVTADHGNAEIMVDIENGQPFTAHTLSPVPLVLVSDAHKNCTLKSGGALKDIAPTILALLGLEKPVEMEGENLLTC